TACAPWSRCSTGSRGAKMLCSIFRPACQCSTSSKQNCSPGPAATCAARRRAPAPRRSLPRRPAGDRRRRRSRQAPDRKALTPPPKVFILTAAARIASGPAAVVAPVVLGGGRPQAAADVLHVRYDQAHGLGGVQAVEQLRVVLERLHVDTELRLQPPAPPPRGGRP